MTLLKHLKIYTSIFLIGSVGFFSGCTSNVPQRSCVTLPIITLDGSNHSKLRESAKKLSFPLTKNQLNLIHSISCTLAKRSYDKKIFRGLSANQVDHAENIAVIAWREYSHHSYHLKTLVLINPSYKHIRPYEDNKAWEQSLSLPHDVGEVWRFSHIRYKYQNALGEHKSAVASAEKARILQQTIDQLQGRLFTDLMTRDSRLLHH
jgi:peptide deformylase